MQNATRNLFIDDIWTLEKIDDNSICTFFDCGDEDLNDYFHNDALPHKEELLTQTYCFYQTEYPNITLALLDFCNDSIRFEKIKKELTIHPHKQHAFLPAVKLTRFGVSKDLQGKNIGSQALNTARKFFLTDNRTGCRFITVDAYNKPEVLRFYEKNGFQPFSDKDKNKDTRALFFDLKRLVI